MKRGVERQDDAHRHQRVRQVQAQDHDAVKRRKGQLAQQHGVNVQVHTAGKARDQDHGQAEQRGEDQPDGRVLLDEAGAVEQLNQPDGEHAHGRRASSSQGD